MPGSWEIQEPTALWWTALCVLPALIFFFCRPRPRKVSWGAMRFLVQAQKRTRRKTQFREILTLFLQSGAILGIVFAAARPVFLEKALETAGGSSSVSKNAGGFHLILFDNSASMGAEFEDSEDGEIKSRLEAARRAALRQIGIWKRNGAERILVLPTNTGENDLGEFFSKPEICLERIFTENESADWSGTLERVKRLDGECAEILVFSDFGKNEASEALDGIRRLRPNAKLRAVPVNTASPNVRVSGLEMKETPVLAGRKQIVRVTLRNESDMVSPSVCVNLKLGQKEAGEGNFRFFKLEQKWLRMSAQEEKDVEFDVNFPEIGEYLLNAEIEIVGEERKLESDGFSQDNFRNLIVQAKERGVFLIAEAWNSEFQSEKTAGAPYIRAVLEGIFSDRFPETSSPVLKIDSLKDVDFSGWDLTRYDVLFLCGFPFFTPEESKALTDYAQGGGSVCIFPGEETGERTLDGLESILPGSFSGKFSESDDFLRAVIPEEKSVVTEIFRKHPDSGLEQVPVMRWIPIKMNSDGTQVLKLSNDSVLLAVRELADGGRSAVWAIPADSTGSALPLFPVWAPLIERTLHFLTFSTKKLSRENENCPEEESQFLNRTLAPGEFPEGWEILLPERIETLASEENEKSPWISTLFLFSAIAAWWAGFCVSREV